MALTTAPEKHDSALLCPPFLTSGRAAMELELEAARGGGRGGKVVSLFGESPAADLGRGDLVPPADHTVSRRHVSLRLLLGGEEPRVAFEVVGRNPVVVRSSVGGDKVYRAGEAGELREGDGFSLSLKVPSFWMVRRSGGNGEAKAEADVDAEVLDAVARREKRTRERKERERRTVEEPMVVTEEEEDEDEMAAVSGELDPEVEDLKFDLASIDPVQEFGFLSMGHEFDNYPKGRIRPPKDWNWFLEETRKSSDDEDDNVSSKGGRSKGSRGGKKKKKEGEEDWTDKSEDEIEHLRTGPSVKRPKKYVTRSTDPKKPRTDNSPAKVGNNDDTDEEEDEDEEDKTLGGFIVTEEDAAMERPSEDEEEEEFDDEDEDD